jgi:ankyrin repeat protein
LSPDFFFSPAIEMCADGEQHTETVGRVLRVENPRRAKFRHFIDSLGPNGSTALIFAANHDNCVHIETLVNQGGADLDLEAFEFNDDPAYAGNNAFGPLVLKQRYTPLISAAVTGSLAAMQLLVRLGAKVDLQLATPSGCGHGIGTTALWWAAFAGHLVCVNFLLQQGASPTAVDSLDGLTAMHVAARNNHEHIVELLVDWGAPVDPMMAPTSTLRGATPLFLSVQANNPRMLSTLLDLRASPHAVVGSAQRTPLFEAVQRAPLHNSRHPMSFLLLKAGADPTAFELRVPHDSPFQLAIKAGNVELVHMMLEFGADPNKRGRSTWSPLVVAADRSLMTILKLLFKHGADPNQQHPLVRYATSRNLQVVKLLLENGADVHLPDSNGMHAITAAARVGSFTIAQLLVMYGARITGHHNNLRLVQLAYRANNREFALWLEVAQGFTPLEQVAASRAFQTGPLLLRRGLLDRLTPGSHVAAQRVRSLNPWGPRWIAPDSPRTVAFVDQVLAGWAPSRHHTYSDVMQRLIYTLLLVECRLVVSTPRTRGERLPPEIWRLIATMLM